MTTRKTKPAAPSRKIGANVSDCMVNMNPKQTNEHDVAGVVALANAASMNAEAIVKIAEILKPSQAPSYGIYLDNIRADNGGE